MADATPILFRFTAENTATGEKTAFIGQGKGMKDSALEGIANCNEAGTEKLAVTLRSGEVVFRTVAEFESRVPYAAPAPEVKVEEY